MLAERILAEFGVIELKYLGQFLSEFINPAIASGQNVDIDLHAPGLNIAGNELARGKRSWQHLFGFDEPESLLVPGRSRNDRLVAMTTNSPGSTPCEADLGCGEVRGITVEREPARCIEQIRPFR